MDALSDERTVIAEPLAAAGYETAGFHSNLFLSGDFGYGNGFNTFYDSKPEPSRVDRLRSIVKNRLDSDGIFYNLLARGVDQVERNVGVNIGSPYTTADSITELAIEWIEEIETDQPAFLWVHYMDPHHPYVPPKSFQSEFRDSPLSERRALKLRRKMVDDPKGVTEAEQQNLIDLYDAEIRFTDKHIGRLVEAFRERDGNPFIVFTADHGEEFHDHGQYSHNSTFYDEVIHVPLIINDGSEPGIYDDIIGLVDVPATIVQQALGSTPQSYCGYDISALFSGGNFEREYIISEADKGDGEMEFSVRTADWKFIKRTDGKALYNLNEDADETTDVQSEHPAKIERFQSILDRHIEEIKNTAIETSDVKIEESVRQRLQDLGYD
jgi:arylsulfatase A-like enzyme